MIDNESPEEEAEGEHFLDVAPVRDSLDLMLREFTRETDRGAVLIAADIVSAHLKDVIESLKPVEFAEKRIKELFRYPGLLASFSARADIAFLAGFISETAHGSIDRLRRLRNKAAHSQFGFSLSAYLPELREITDLGPGVPVEVNRMANQFIIDNVVHEMTERGLALETEIGRNPFSTPGEILDELSKRPEVMKKLGDRLPRMELAFGVWLLLGLLRHKETQAVPQDVEIPEQPRAHESGVEERS